MRSLLLLPLVFLLACGAGDVEPSDLDLAMQAAADDYGVPYPVLAANGEEAVALLARHPEPVQIALLDVSMPRLGGPEAARRMRELRPGLPVLFMTGYDLESALAGEATKSGDQVLSKPFRVAALAQALRQVLRTAGDTDIDGT